MTRSALEMAQGTRVEARTILVRQARWDSIMGTTKKDWVMILDIFTGKIHCAHPDEKQKDRYVTACGLLADLTKRGRYMRITGDSDEGDETAEPTCDECFMEFDSPIGDVVRKVLDDTLGHP